MSKSPKNEFRMSKKNDSIIVRFWLQVCKTLSFYTAYKRKNQKIRSVNFDESNDFMSDESDNWKKKILKNEKKRYSFDFVDKYREYLISRFSEMKRSERLWNDRLSRIRIDEKLSVQKKKLLTEMLYRRKICLIWKFSKIEKIKSKINSSVKIRTIFHQIWQISNFQISRALNDVISMMIKKRLRNKILKSCYNSYRNFWFLVKKKEIEKYRFVNATLKMNRIIIRDVNFFFLLTIFLSNSLIVWWLFSWIYFSVMIRFF